MNTRTDSQVSRPAISGLRAGMLLSVALIALNIVGCGGSESQIDRKPIYGKIVGTEGRSGIVTFTPIDSLAGPAATNNFEAGEYRFTKENGPQSGKHNISVELEVSVSLAEMPKNLRGSRPPTLAYEAVEKTITASVPAEGPFEIDLDITN